MESMRVFVPAALGLLGTLFGLWLGHWRWSSELRMNRRKAFDARRHRAYEELWSIVESAHIALRTAAPSVADVRQLDQQINAYRMKNAVLLDAPDAELSNRYFNSVVALSRQIAESGSRELAERFTHTDAIAATDVAGVNELVEATAEVNRLRDELISRVRAVMLETSYAVGSP